MGERDKISILNHAWVLGAVDYKLIKPVNISSLEFVAELIDLTTRSWKEELITNIFGASDAERILRIHLATNPCDDELA